jgi:CRISPR/Cas system-associated protein Cas5 (RAMP superfamily)
MIKFNISSKKPKLTTTDSWYGSKDKSSSDDESDAGSSISVQNEYKISDQNCIISPKKYVKNVCKEDMKKMSREKKRLMRLDKINRYNIRDTADLRDFVKDQDKVTTKFTRDGQIIISGVRLLFPDFATEHAKKYEKELEKIKDINCKERVMISRWVRVISLVAIFLTGVIIVGGLIYLIHKAFFASDE